MTQTDDTPQNVEQRFCGAKKKGGEGTCKRPAGWGTDHVGWGVCKLHFGRVPNQMVRAQRLEAVDAVQRFGGRLDIHPAQALLDLVQRKAALVAYLEARVIAASPGGVVSVWGKTRSEQGSNGGFDVSGEVFEATPPPEFKMMVEAERDLEKYASAALRAGVEAQLVDLAKLKASGIVDILDKALTIAGVPVADRSRIVEQAFVSTGGKQ